MPHFDLLIDIPELRVSVRMLFSFEHFGVLELGLTGFEPNGSPMVGALGTPDEDASDKRVRDVP